MNVHEHRFLLSQQATLKKLLSETDESEVIVRMSLNVRLREVEEQLESYDGYSPRVVNARLTFRGKPTMGSRAIRADFGLDATRAFVDAVAKVGRGWGGSDADYGLLVTATARGSFGFEVEDATQMPPLMGESTPVERAMEHVRDILRATTGTDDQLIDAIEDTDDGALNALHGFLKIVGDGDAMCALELQGDEFSFVSADQVQRSAGRLDQKNISVEDVDLNGRLQGIMPKGRRAEFVVEETGEVITARVQAPVAESLLTAEMLGKPLSISARARRVGSSRPTYVITGYDTASPKA